MKWALVPALIAASLFVGVAGAHEVRPSLLDVTPVGEGRYRIQWSAAPGSERVRAVFPERCTTDGETGLLDCGPQGLTGARIAAREMAPLRDEVLVRLHFPGGTRTALLSAAQPSFEVPSPPEEGSRAQHGSPARPALSAIGSFALLGAAHLVTGLDHVLFLIGVLFLAGAERSSAAGGAARSPLRAILLSVTAFTVAHSASLALQVLGAVHLPPAPVEATIALSVLFVAREILRPPEARTLAQRSPHVVTFAFGLLHGLGFAGGLASMDVPRTEIPAALFGFNVGLELAQIALVIAALAIARAARPWARRWPRWTKRVPAYSLGAAAAFWLLSRTAAMWS